MYQNCNFFNKYHNNAVSDIKLYISYYTSQQVLIKKLITIGNHCQYTKTLTEGI